MLLIARVSTLRGLQNTPCTIELVTRLNVNAVIFGTKFSILYSMFFRRWYFVTSKMLHLYYRYDTVQQFIRSQTFLARRIVIQKRGISTVTPFRYNFINRDRLIFFLENYCNHASDAQRHRSIDSANPIVYGERRCNDYRSVFVDRTIKIMRDVKLSDVRYFMAMLKRAVCDHCTSTPSKNLDSSYVISPLYFLHFCIVNPILLNMHFIQPAQSILVLSKLAISNLTMRN